MLKQNQDQPLQTFLSFLTFARVFSTQYNDLQGLYEESLSRTLSRSSSQSKIKVKQTVRRATTVMSLHETEGPIMYASRGTTATHYTIALEIQKTCISCHTPGKVICTNKTNIAEVSRLSFHNSYSFSSRFYETKLGHLKE